MPGCPDEFVDVDPCRRRVLRGTLGRLVPDIMWVIGDQVASLAGAAARHWASENRAELEAQLSGVRWSEPKTTSQGEGESVTRPLIGIEHRHPQRPPCSEQSCVAGCGHHFWVVEFGS